MWSGFDPEIQRQLAGLRELVARRHQAPVREWALVFVQEFDALLVVREWAGGNITAYATSEISSGDPGGAAPPD